MDVSDDPRSTVGIRHGPEDAAISTDIDGGRDNGCSTITVRDPGLPRVSVRWSDRHTRPHPKL